MGIMDIFAQLGEQRRSHGDDVTTGVPTYLVVGLGNPEEQYERTRHNAGFLAIDAIAKEGGVSLHQTKFQSQVATMMMGNGERKEKCLLMKPLTYMNRSGQAVVEAMQFYKVPPERVILLFDDISLPIGRLRIRRKGSDGGHNGMKNIIYLSGKDNFLRIKIGVGEKPHPDYALADWVLSRFSADEQTALAPVLTDCVKGTHLLVAGEIDQAMNQYN